MKLVDVINNIDKSKENEDWINTDDLGYALGIYDMEWINQDRIKSYWVGSWMCTDTQVGYKVYYFDNEPCAFSIQPARKSDEKFQWFSEELALKVRDYLLSLMKNEYELNIEVVDINSDIGDNYKINFSGQIMNRNKATYNGERVVILERIKNVPYGIDTELRVKLLNGEILNVDVTDLDFEFNLVQ